MVFATTWLCTAAAMAGWSLLPVAAGWRPYVIVSGSMAPQIRPGDVVCVDPAALARLVRGQVVVVHDPVRPGRLLAHRVVEIRADGSLLTKGDANPVPDSTAVPAGAAVGVVRLVVPSIGRLTLARSDPGPDELALVGATVLAALLITVLGADQQRQARPGDDPPRQRGPRRALRRGLHRGLHRGLRRGLHRGRPAVQVGPRPWGPATRSLRRGAPACRRAAR